LMSLASAIVLLFLVMAPVGSIPIFVSVLARVDSRRRVTVLIRELLVALLLLVIFLLLGRHILDLLQVKRPALTVAGGVILFLIAMRMIFPTAETPFGQAPEGEPLVVPLATPLIAGPSAAATVLLLVATDPAALPKWGLALLVAWMMTSALLLASTQLSRVLGERGLAALERLMGMLLTVIAVQMFLTGISSFLGQ
jgi:multiple antibiotic resistance protein